VHSQGDLLLGLVYRATAALTAGAAGISPVRAHGVENVDVTRLVTYHFQYPQRMPELLELVAL